MVLAFRTRHGGVFVAVCEHRQCLLTSRFTLDVSNSPLTVSFCPLQLVMHGHLANHTSDVLRSLGGLSSLQQLDLGLARLPSLHLWMSLGSLVNLQDCSISVSDSSMFSHSLVDVAAVFTLTRLARLSLTSMTHNSKRLSPAEATACRLAVSPLTAMQHLHTLALGKDFKVDDMVMATLQRLSKLRSLAVGNVLLSTPTPGHLPLLEELVLHRFLTPAKLLQSLLPLQPLAKLVTLGGLGLEVLVGTTTDAAAAAEAAELRLVSTILARSSVKVLHVSLLADSDDALVSPLMLAQALAPLAECILDLHVLNYRARALLLEPEWAVLTLHLPHIRVFSFSYCLVSEALLVAIASQWSSLRSLIMINCKGLTDQAWLGLAVTRGTPLVVRAIPPLCPLLEERCLLLQDQMFDRRHLVFQV